MRLFVAIRMKNDIPRDQRAPLNAAVRSAYSAMERMQPWESDGTISDLRWAPQDGRVAVLFRSNEEPSSPERAGWIGNKARIWAWSGVMGSDLHASLRSQRADYADAEAVWNGIGSFALIGATPDTIVAFTNHHRSEGLFWISTPTTVVVSNSAALLSMMQTGGDPEYSRVGTAAFLMHALPFADATPFLDVRTLDAAARLTSDSRTDVRIEFDDVPKIEDSQDIDQTAEEIARGLTEYAQVLSAGSADVTAAITGGKDSRLVVAALHAAGVDFSTYTNGLPESGEAAVGRQVASALRLPHKLNSPRLSKSTSGRSVIRATPEVQAWNTLRSTGGMGNAFTVLGDPHRPHVSIAEKTNFGGQGGEIIRGGFSRYLPLEELTADGAKKLLVKLWFNNQDLLSPLAVEAVNADVRHLFDAADRDPVEAPFLGYITNRTGRWLTTMRHGESVLNSHTTLLINNQMVRLLRSLPSNELVGEKIAHAVMSRLAPQVVDLPFFRDRWEFEKNRPNPDYKPESWSDRAPYTAHDQPRADFNWRTAFSPALSEFFRDQIFGQGSDLVLDVINERAVRDMLAGRRYRAPAAWALFSAQFMADNRWLDKQPVSPVTVEIDVPD